MALIHVPFRLGPMDNGTFILACERTRRAAVIDVGFEAATVLRTIRDEKFEVVLLLNTHGHYDHVSGMREIQHAVGGQYWIHPADRPLIEKLTQQGAMFGLPPAEPPDDPHDLFDGQKIQLGDESLEVIHTPGHTPGGVTFRCGNDLWVGDTLFQGSVGRTDLPGGSFPDLERSIRTRLFPLGDALRCFTGHGPPTTIGEERLHNPFVGEHARFA